MHPQRTLIEAAMLVQEIALVRPEDRHQGYDTKYHAEAAMNEILKLKRPSADDGKEAVQRYHGQVRSIIQQHHPLDHHAEEAAASLAKHYKNHSSVGESVPDDVIVTVMGHHYGGYMGDILKHHSTKYPKFLDGHKPTVNKHMDQFENSVSEILGGLHGLRVTDTGIEPIH